MSLPAIPTLTRTKPLDCRPADMLYAICYIDHRVHVRLGVYNKVLDEGLGLFILSRYDKRGPNRTRLVKPVRVASFLVS